jgi:ATP-dependent RNA helicase RhlE
MANRISRNPLKRRQSAGYNQWKRHKEYSEGKGLYQKMYINPALSKAEHIMFGERLFEELGLHSELLALLKEKGFEKPTLIQDQSFDHIYQGKDVLGIAKTGTGKTLAFLLPLLQRHFEQGKSEFKTLIVAPTRELALQIEQELKSLIKERKIYSACLIGGTRVKQDLQDLKNPKDFIIGTPGRLIDLYHRKALKLQQFSVLILDEFDRMLDMGFSEQTMELADAMQQRNQTLCFSATTEGRAGRLLRRLAKDPIELHVSDGASTSDRVDEDIVNVPAGKKKFTVLCEMLQKPEFNKVLIFAETKRDVHMLTVKLQREGIKADAIHGDKQQRERKAALTKFRQGDLKVLVATDIASRGIDVDDITHVINYDKPENYEDYLHRIGRTGRAGKSGKALTFLD